MRDIGAGELPNRRAALGALLVGGAGVVSIGGFLFARDVIGPERLTAGRIVDRLQAVGGRFPGFRRNHAKGVAVAGRFESNGGAAELSTASVFRAGNHALRGRFSLSGGNPDQTDAVGAVRGLGLWFALPGGEQWRTAMVNLPVFPDPTPRDFYDRQLAYAPDPATGKPNPHRVAAYLAAHPETAAAMRVIAAHPPSPTFATSIFRGLNAFWCVGDAGRRTPVRWELTPRNGPTTPSSAGRDVLFDDLVTALRRGPLSWTLTVIVGVAGQDPTDNASVPWPSERRRIEAGTVVLTDIATETAANVRDVNFDPLVLPGGIEPSNDPLLQARSAAYAESYRRRAGEPGCPGSVRVVGL
ncbi:catalase family peroxidase [Nocardia jiangxiensis]|uniref:Catalase-related peroxidase n=1 Tax=Nocardia jiangxiensis TaxID=282685 RepID=A0ABW6SDH3_9NOCA